MRTIKEILDDFKKALRIGYQAPKNVVDISERYIHELSEADFGGKGGVDYSTDEQDTGLKWIDGSSIYCKTVDMGTSNNATGASYSANHGIGSFSHIIKYEFVAYKTNQSAFMLNCSVANSNLATWSVEVGATAITVWSNTANPGYQGYCTVYYVK